MMLKTKCIKAPKTPADGTRISIMRRHTLNDGSTPDADLEGTFDGWMPELGPPSRLLGDYYKRGLPWDEFESRFRKYLENPDVINRLRFVAKRALKDDITLLCIEPTADLCHRRLVAEMCKRFEPDLEVAIE